jgi:acetyl-CoA carboxylase carboxyl transferase subunit beta
VPRQRAWDVVISSRDPARPGVRALLRHAAQSVTPLHGTGEGENEAGLILALARFGAAPPVVVGHDRAAELDGHPVGSAALRIARRGMRLAAAELRLPLVTVIDTAGAELSGRPRSAV